MFKRLILVGLFCSLSAFAADDIFEFSSQTSWVNQANVYKRDATLFNPDNSALDLPSSEANTELRPNLKLTYGNHFLGVACPRLKLYYKSADPDEAQGSAGLNEIYGQIPLSDDILVAYGKMNYQWGPAELLSPSNRLFENVEMQPSPLFEYVGKNLARLNVTYEKHLNFILLGEVKMDGASKGDTLVLKTEYSLHEGADYAGIVIGRSRTEKNWIGEYLAYTPSDALQVYFDISHMHGSALPSAQKNKLGFWQLGDSTRSKTELETHALLGGRFTSERGNELRSEFFYQTDGYSGSDLEDLRASLKSSEPFHLLNLSRYYQNTSPLQGKFYGYLAYRVPDVDPKKKLQITPRYLQSFQDGSGVFFFTAEYNISSSWVAQAVATYAHGDADTELAKNNRMSASGALQFSF